MSHPGDSSPDLDVAQFATSVQAFLESMRKAADARSIELTSLGEEVRRHLGVDIESVDPVVESFPNHQAIDLDAALAAVLERCGGRMLGVGGPSVQHIDRLGDALERSHWNYRLGAVGYVRRPTGVDSARRVVQSGLAFLVYDDVPLVWFQRGASPQYGRNSYTLELLCPDPDTVVRLLDEVRSRMARDSILRGQVISFQSNEFDYHAPGEDLTFLARPAVSAADVVLPDGVLDRIVGHVVGIAEQRDRLRAAGQHLKRGVLLYGPPGTGKTHVIRHLIARTPGTTVVLLSGRTLGLVGAAARLARAAQPAIVVLEDCDLIAEERGGDTNAALFETLEALDGLDGDADVTFILTTNRPDLLERALSERPGRVDLAVQIDRPDLSGRRRLLELYGCELIERGQLSDEAVAATAEQIEGVTASFVKELIRRTVIAAATASREPTDQDLYDAAADMASDAELFTRVLLGGADGSVFADRSADRSADPSADPSEDPSVEETGGSQPGPRPGVHGDDAAYHSSWRMEFDEA